MYIYMLKVNKNLRRKKNFATYPWVFCGPVRPVVKTNLDRDKNRDTK
jgi:hypothetical protein